MFYSEIQKVTGNTGMNSNDHRRHAIQIVAALPDEMVDALKVLDFARQLVVEFLSDQRPDDRDADRRLGAVVSLSSASKGASF